VPDARKLVATGRRLIASTLLDEALIGDRSLVGDGYGGWTETWVDRTSTTPCRYVPRQMGIQTDSDPRTGVGEFGSPEGIAVLFPVGTDVVEGDRITDPATDARWIVTAERTPASRLQTVVRVIVREMDASSP
jgi:hypothetical protein